MKQNTFFFASMLTIALISCSPSEKKDAFVVSKPVKESKYNAEAVKAIKASIGYDKFHYPANINKPWREVWAFYQKIPKLCAEKGFDNPTDIQNVKTPLLLALLSPMMYGALNSHDKPTHTEALAIIEEYVNAPILVPSIKAIAYKYLKNEGLEKEAETMLQKTQSKGGNVAEFDKLIQRIIDEKNASQKVETSAEKNKRDADVVKELQNFLQK